ncbi:MAG TPA: C13 family peptidase [Gammaproteobacteria bacterium]
MKDHLRNLLTNLAAGIRLARLAPTSTADFRISPDQVLLLLLFDLAADAVTGLLGNLPDPVFNVYAIPVYGFHFAVLLLCAYLVRSLGTAERNLLFVPAAMLSLAPVVYVFWYPVMWAQNQVFDGEAVTPTVLYGLYFAWLFAVVLRIIGLTRPLSALRHSMAMTAMLVTWFVPSWYFSGQSEFWYPADSDDTEDDPYAAFRNLDAEAIFYTQPPLLEQSFVPLQAQRAGLIDAYFVGFAGYARQDVFLKETRYAQDLFDRNFDTAGRSLVLANHLSTYASTPLANGHNLAASLKAIGARMNADEDILVMYMTSHGSKEQGLSADFWPLKLNDIKPDVLKRYLDEAGIKWRVLMISSCYSGIFVDTLKDPHTVIATAAAADRTSFGCGDHNDFTYFGEAVLKDQLSHRHGIVEALQEASAEIVRREQAEGIEEHSEPQIFVGDAIAPKLKLLEDQLAERAERLVAVGK